MKFTPHPHISESLSTGEVGLLCGVSPQTVINWIRAGRFTAFRLGERGPRRIPCVQVVTFLRECSAPIPEYLLKYEKVAA